MKLSASGGIRQNWTPSIDISEVVSPLIAEVELGEGTLVSVSVAMLFAARCGLIEEAERTWGSASFLDTKSPVLRLGEGLLHYYNGRYGKAWAHFASLRGELPRDPI